eukprot:scaffold158446_cov18-Tisochrysis_lutea.AAC.1
MLPRLSQLTLEHSALHCAGPIHLYFTIAAPGGLAKGVGMEEDASTCLHYTHQEAAVVARQGTKGQGEGQ